MLYGFELFGVLDFVYVVVIEFFEEVVGFDFIFGFSVFDFVGEIFEECVL